MNDLSCDGTGGPDVELDAGARLMLADHSISGGYIGVAINAEKVKSIVRGPGEIFGQSGPPRVNGCAISTGASTIIDSVDVHDGRCGIVTFYTAPLLLSQVTVHDNAEDGVGYALPVDKGKVKVLSGTFTNNGGFGIESYGRMSLESVHVHDNAAGGASAGTILKARRGEFFSNGPGGDLAAFIRAKIDALTTCEHSVVSNPAKNDSFHICSLDTP